MSDDRERLNDLLQGLDGYRLRGDLVLVRPKWSSTQGVHQSEKAVIIEATVDVGESFVPDGLRLERFRNNPVVVWSHDYDGLPVARSLWERVRLNANEPVLFTKLQFHRDTEFSREAWDLVKGGDGIKWELGVLPTKWDFNTGTKVLVTEWDLVEVSAVPDEKGVEMIRRGIKERRIGSPRILRSVGELNLVGPPLIGEEKPEPEPKRVRIDGKTVEEAQKASDAEGPYTWDWRGNGKGVIRGPGFERVVRTVEDVQARTDELNAAWRLGRDEAMLTAEAPAATEVDCRVAALEEWRGEIEKRFAYARTVMGGEV